MDPDRFGEWVTIHRKVNSADPGPPREGMKMEQTLCLRGASFKVKWTLEECADGTRAVCLWEADSVEKVRDVVDGAAGDISNNEFFEVDPGHPATSGLPVSSAAGA